MSITVTHLVNPATYSGYKAFHVPHVTIQTLPTVAARYGFYHLGGNEFMHQDGSWIAVINGRIERGVGNAKFQGMPHSNHQAPAQTGYSGSSSYSSSSNIPGLGGPVVGCGDLNALQNYFNNDAQAIEQAILRSGYLLTRQAHGVARGMGINRVAMHPNY